MQLLLKISDKIVAFNYKIDLINFENLTDIENLIDTENLIIDLNTEIQADQLTVADYFNNLNQSLVHEIKTDYKINIHCVAVYFN